MDTKHPSEEPEHQGNVTRWQERRGPSQALIYVPRASADAEARKKRANQVARCRRKAQKSGMKVAQVFDDMNAALRALVADNATALFVVSLTELASRPKDVLALRKRLGEASARILACELIDQKIANDKAEVARQSEAQRKRVADGRVTGSSTIRLVPNGQEIVTERRSYRLNFTGAQSKPSATPDEATTGSRE